MLKILTKAYCVNVMVDLKQPRLQSNFDLKPIYLNKRYLFQKKICYLDKTYFCFAKIRLSKLILYKGA